MPKTTAAITLAAAASLALAGTELVTNGGFETGDDTGWTYLPTGGSSFTLTGDANSGSFAGELFNDTDASAALLRQGNIGAGQLSMGDTIDISFAVKGEGAVGGVAFAVLFTEIAGGGVSSTQFVGGAPLTLGSDYAVFNASVELTADVSGGVTLSFEAVTGANSDSEIRLFVDDVSVTADLGPAGCNAADLAEPFGVLDLGDITAFVAAFVAMDPSVDFDGNSVFDLADITAFISAFTAGCP